MPAISARTTIAELLEQQPARAQVFDKLGIDQCCSAKRPLKDVCAERRLEPETVVRMLEACDEQHARAEPELRRFDD